MKNSRLTSGLGPTIPYGEPQNGIFYATPWASSGQILIFVVANDRNSKQSEPRHEISNNVVCATSKASD